MIETNDYCIIEDQFIFKPHFDLSINVYKNIISQYNKLVFSNYTDVDICAKTNNTFDSIYFNKYLSSIFNKKVDLPPNLIYLTFGNSFNQVVDLPLNLTHIIFGNKFNKKVDLPPNLIYLTFGNSFNQPVDLPSNLTHIIFGIKFNQKVDLPSNLVHIYFGNSFNQVVDLPQNLINLTFGNNFNQVVDLPLDIIYLKINCNNKYLIDYLPDSIEELVLDLNFDLELNDLPQSIKKISFNSYNYNKELNCLPSNIEYMELPLFYKKKIVKYPNKLKTIKCSYNYKYIDLLKEKGYEVLTY